jgi:hypothetical protein
MFRRGKKADPGVVRRYPSGLFDRSPIGERCSGVIYLVLWLYGLVINVAQPANFVPVNMADNWLHLALTVGMLALSLLLGRRPANAVGSHV